MISLLPFIKCTSRSATILVLSGCLLGGFGNTSANDLVVEELNQLLEQEASTLESSSPVLNNHAFARRAHLAIIGRIPTLSELESFLASPDRKALIDHLLQHPGRLSHDYNWWADLLRIKTRVPGIPYNSILAYSAWLRQALAENRPYDELVHELISARGYSGDHGAVGFYQRDRGMPLDHLANTAQTFLGTHLACAQCHDHPFEEWTQMDFYKLAAFSAPMEVSTFPDGKLADLSPIHDLMTRRERQINGQSFSAVSRIIRNTGVKETYEPLELPHDYQYDDGEPGEVVIPQTPFGDLVDLADEQSRIEAYADWMTARSNPRFTRVIANRIWKRIYGAGIIEPVDDLDAGRKIASEEILNTLAELLQSLDFDLLEFQRVLYHLPAFERRAVAYDTTSGDRFSFSAPAIRRLSAEQIYDSINVLIRDDIDETFNLTPSGRTAGIERSARRKIESTSLVDLLHQTRAIDAHIETAARRTNAFRVEYDTFSPSEDSKAARDWFDRLTKQTDQDLAEFSELLGIGSGPEPARMVHPPYLGIRKNLATIASRTFPGIREDFVHYFFQAEQSYQGSREEDKEKKRILAERKRITQSEGAAVANEYFRSAHHLLRKNKAQRASELGNPSPETHFLRELGQSDRELINNSRRDTTIPQLLELRNGPTLRSLHNLESSLWKNLGDSKDADTLIKRLYLQMLNREPRDYELELLRPEFEDRYGGIVQTIWVLLNTSEFCFAP